MHNSTLVATVKNGVEESIAQLQTFIRPSVDFCNRPEFREEFCIGYVRIGVVMHFLGHLLESAAVSQPSQPYLSLLKCCISVTHSSVSGLYVFQYPALLVGCISVTSSPVSGLYFSYVHLPCLGILLLPWQHFKESKTPPTVILILSKFCHTLSTNSILYLMSLADERFPPSETGPLQHLPTSGLVEQAWGTGKVRVGRRGRRREGVGYRRWGEG